MAIASASYMLGAYDLQGREGALSLHYLPGVIIAIQIPIYLALILIFKRL